MVKPAAITLSLSAVVHAVDPSNDQQLMWFVAACGLQIMKALRSKDPVERARVRAMIKNALMHVAAAPKPLSKPVGGGTRLLVGPLLEEAFSFMERTAFLCWLQFGMDREVRDRELGLLCLLHSKAARLRAGGLS